MRFDTKELKENCDNLISPIKSPPSNIFTSESIEFSNSGVGAVDDKSSSAPFNPHKKQSRLLSKNKLIKKSKTYKPIIKSPETLQTMQSIKTTSIHEKSVYETLENINDREILNKLKDNEKHKKTLSTLHFTFTKNSKIDDFKINDENYKKFLGVNDAKDPLKTLIKESEILLNNKSKKHIKKASCNNEFFLKNKITSMLGDEHKKYETIGNTNNIGTNKADNKLKGNLIIEKIKKSKSKSDNKIFHINESVGKLTFDGSDVKELTEEDDLAEIKIKNDSNSKSNKEKKVCIGQGQGKVIETALHKKTNIFEELTKTDKDLNNLMKISYNKLNSSNISDEISIDNFSLTDHFATKNQNENCINFENDERYLKKMLFNN